MTANRLWQIWPVRARLTGLRGCRVFSIRPGWDDQAKREYPDQGQEQEQND
jgi:hypothetical protein